MRYLVLISKVALAAVSLWLISEHLNQETLAYLFSSPLWFVVVLIGWAINLVLTGIRSFIMLRQIGHPFKVGSVMRAHMSALFLGGMIPGVVGVDIIKGAYLKNYSRTTSLASIVSTLIVDRLFGIGAIVVWTALMGIIAVQMFIPDKTHFVLYSIAIAVSLGVGFLIFRVIIKRDAPSLLPVTLKQIWRSMRTLTDFSDRRYFSTVMLVNFTAVLILLLSVSLVGGLMHQSVSGNPHFVLQFFLLAVTLLATAAPITPFGVGIGQLTAATIYSAVGLDPSVGIVVSTMQQLSLVAVIVCLGLPFFVLDLFDQRNRESDASSLLESGE